MRMGGSTNLVEIELGHVRTAHAHEHVALLDLVRVRVRARVGSPSLTWLGLG